MIYSLVFRRLATPAILKFAVARQRAGAAENQTELFWKQETAVQALDTSATVVVLVVEPVAAVRRKQPRLAVLPRISESTN